MKPRVVILNNQIMPYRLPLFHALAEIPDYDTAIWYCSDHFKDREWDTSQFHITYPHRILHGFTFSLPKPNYEEARTIIINRSLILDLINARPEIIIGYEYSVPALTALIASKLIGAKYLTWTEMTGHAERSLTTGQNLTRRMIRPRADAFICTSNASRDHLVEQGTDPNAIFVAPQTFTSQWYEEQVDTRSDVITLIFSGQLNQRKGVDRLIDAMRILSLEGRNIQLLLAGNGPLRQHLADRVAQYDLENVRFVGFLEPHHLPSFYQQGHIFVFPSFEDTFGVVVLEAIASNLAVICSPYAGVASHLTHEEHALIVDPNDVQALADSIRTLVDDGALRERLQANARQQLKQFTPTQVAERFHEAIEYVLKTQ